MRASDFSGDFSGLGPEGARREYGIWLRRVRFRNGSPTRNPARPLRLGAWADGRRNGEKQPSLVASPPALWDIGVRPSTSRYMRTTASSIARISLKAGSITLLWLLSASAAEAAIAPGRLAAGPACDPQTTTLRRLSRHAKSFGGPVAVSPARSLYGLTDLTARMRRGTRVALGDRLAAIPSAPAARIDADHRLLPSLRPLGELVGSVDGRPHTHASSPRSPRGPPASA